MSAVEQRDPGMELVRTLKSDRIREQIAAALPEGVGIERFERAAATAFLTKPELASAERVSLFQALVRCAHLGLMPDGRQAAIIVDRHKKAQVREMIGGYRDLLAAHGWALRTQAVREGDEFDYTDEPPMILHRKALERGAITHAYAVAIHRDGRRAQAVLDATMIAKRRAMAQSANVWDSWPDEQAEKTAGKYLATRIGLDASDKRVSRLLVEDLAPGESRALLYPSPAPELPQGSPPPPADDGQQAAPVDPPLDPGAAPGFADDLPEEDIPWPGDES